MSSLKNTMSSKSSTPSFDERRWVINIRQTLEAELEEDTEIPVSIFNVPKILLSCDPDSYTPQLIAIGPYHYWRPELNEMERYKIAAAKRAQKNLLNDLQLCDVVEQLVKIDPKIRACYHKLLDFSNETLGWMMAIDASFLLEFLQIYAIKEGKLLTRVSSRMSHLADYAGRKSTRNAILRDMMMLENQIPLFVLRKMLEVQSSCLEQADDLLLSMLTGLCKDVSPFKMMNELPKVHVSETSHLLDSLYDMIVPYKIQLRISSEISQFDDNQNECIKDEDEGISEADEDPGYVKKLLGEIWSLLTKLNGGPIRMVKKLLMSKPIKLMFQLPWIILSKFPGLSLLKQPMEQFFNKEDKEDDKSDGNLLTITFDVKTITFYLPTVTLDVNTEVILRNLVAYEASNATGPLVLTRYTELMNGIIDTEEDVKLLRERGIILNRLKSDKEAAALWNGMSKSIRLTKVPFLDKAIEEVNKYYNGRWNIKAKRMMKAYVFGSWQVLTLLAAIMLLLLMGLQTFCSAYTCNKVLRLSTGGGSNS
ncbi:hypothetical protein CCACVL1_00418 [Corchorus capsularis]|uniref:Uncharacterized protein n=1 Tax=Corchorus capsularis TaxID=210143 RepID=A0A1R3KWX7_COCAP|nr:hypothetical protein CCACVL1_00418 [Corchorus capsularis]